MFKLVYFEVRRHPVTTEQHAQQKRRVQGSLQLSDKRAERRQEAATIARLYPRSERDVSNVVPFSSRLRKPEPPYAA